MRGARLAIAVVSLALPAAPSALGAQQDSAGPGGAEVVAESVFVRDVGPGEAGRLLRRALLAPHLALHSAERLELPRDTTISTSVIVIGGGDVGVGSVVEGDVFVVGGDLFMHPGGRIDGRAVAIGGGVYRSELASIAGGVHAFRDVTYDAIYTGDGIALDYRQLVAPADIPLVTLPAFRGLREPTYDRVNGLTLAAGPRFQLAEGRIFVDPMIVYRSDLGELDPRLVAGARFGRRDSLSLSVERGTFTNDDWIRTDRWNSVLALVTGKDTRNWFRAERAEVRAHRRWEGADGAVTAFIGGRGEDAVSVGPHADLPGPGTGIVSGPWSFLNRGDDVDGMRRPNPRIDPGRMFSALAGATAQWRNERDFRVEGWALVEQGIDAPEPFGGFTQVTLDADLRFPTFRTQSYRFSAHAVLTGPDIAPRQRWTYLGGSGTLPTFDVLEFGGDELLFIENRYNVPIDRLSYPIFGTPVVTVRHMIGAAGPGRLPDFEQNIGVRLTVFLVRLDYTIDPGSSDKEFSVGVALSAR
jgi:hypothetical protein